MTHSSNDFVTLSGFAHTRFTRKTESTLLSLMSEVASDAVKTCGLAPADIDHVVLSHFNHGLSRQGFSAGLSAEMDDGFRFKPAIRVESACASGTAAVHLAQGLVLSGQARRVLVIGAEHMSGQPGARIGDILRSAALDGELGEEVKGFAGIFDLLASRYHHRYRDPRPAMARIAYKNRTNGSRNPWAQLRTPPLASSMQEASPENPAVGDYLKKTDCSPISDGAAALVVARAADMPSAAARVRLKAIAQANDFMSMERRDMTRLDGAALMWRTLLGRAGVSNDGLDFAEVHDCFSIAELLLYEAMGLAAPGEGESALNEGVVQIGGVLPVNPSGGLLSKGHPIGATGVSMHVMAGLQLSGQWSAGVPIRKGRAGIINMGGAAVANYGSILEVME